MNPIRAKRKFLRITAVVLVLGIVLFFAGRYILYYKIRNTIIHELTSLKDQGIHVTFANLEVYPWDGKIEVHELEVKVRKDSLKQDLAHDGLNAYLPYITIEGIDPFPFLRNKTLSVQKVHSFETYVTYQLHSTIFDQKKHVKRKIEVENIAIGEIHFPRIDCYLTSSENPDTVAHILTDVDMKDLFLAKQLDSLTWQRGTVDITNFAMNYKSENYGLSFSRIGVGISDRSVVVDSLRVKPLVGHNAFMQWAKKQCSYLDMFVPHLTIRGIDWYTYPSATLHIDRMETQLHASMYRDKRLPFLQREERPLPSHALHRLPIRVRVDTLTVGDSFVRYEEMPESGDSTGVVYFDQLNATIVNIHNNKNIRSDIQMHATAKFMGAGILEANFTFPYDTLRPYRVAGTLKNMPLPRINKILGAAAKAKVESGTMRTLAFEFTYNNDRSSGEIEMNYENLKVLTLRENRKNEQSVSRIKTLLLNAFIIRKDMDEDVKDDKRKGTVDFERDKLKSVFNFWWKSILSGIRSAYNLDKLPLASGDKDANKERKKGLKGVFSRIFKDDKDRGKEDNENKDDR